MDVVKSLRPLIVALNPRSSSRIARLRQTRQELSVKVTDLINTLGPEIFPDFDAERIVADSYRPGAYQSRYKKMPEDPRAPDSIEPTTPTSSAFEEAPAFPGSRTFGSFLPSNESFGNIGGFGFFASRPATPKSHSRSSSAGGALTSAGMPIKAFSTLNDRESFDEVSKRIRGAMRERGRKRESEGAETGTESSWDMASDGQKTPTTEDEEPKKER